MNLIKRILIGIIVLLIAMIIFCLFEKYCVPKKYKYLTMDEEWGISNKCFLDKQLAVCEIDGALEIVRQFYYER